MPKRQISYTIRKKRRKKWNFYRQFGNFDHVIAAVQNGADAVYLGASKFNARAGAPNFDNEDLKKAILYARKRKVDVHLTLNILLFPNELQEALNLAKFAYKCGVSSIIVQDIGLAKELIKRFPDLPIHASTQMTISNLAGVQLLEKMGFKRVVLARELSLQEIAHIRQNTSMELEVFGHGALCVSYSGQCLFSSMVGKRSGNRGLCAGPCRLQYDLLKNGNAIHNGYLLSPKDICTLSILPQLMECGVDSLKIEGRKKSYEYVSIVTKIYRKYMDLAQDKTKEYKVEEQDIHDILQIYNRGGMGTGYFENRQNIVYPEKPNHLGFYVGKVKNVNSKRKQVTIDLKSPLQMGDIISINENTSYISQIVERNTVGEIKEVRHVKIEDPVYKIVDNNLNKKQWENYKKEVKKVDIWSKLYETEGNLCLELKNEDVQVKSMIKYEKTDVNELDKSRISCQIQKTGNTIFRVQEVDIQVEHVKLPISQLNQLRREALEKFEKCWEEKIQRKQEQSVQLAIKPEKTKRYEKPNVNLYVQKWNEKVDYESFDYHEIYVPFKELINHEFGKNCVAVLPNIVDENYEKMLAENRFVFDKVKAVMISHVSQIEILESLGVTKQIVGDYSLNVTNPLSEKVMQDLGIKRLTMSPELDKKTINEFPDGLEKELVVYGRICLMNSKYCPIGQNENCNKACEKGKYALKDRKDFVFPVVSDSTNCHSKIYNSKILSSHYDGIKVDFVRIDILDETQEEIEKIISTVKAGERFTGKQYTNGNLA